MDNQVSNTAIKELMPSLFNCFGIMFIGYLASRCKIFSEAQVQGLGVYISKFALPAVFFRVMVSIDFGGISWLFVLAVSVGKAIIFAASFAFVFLVLSGNQQQASRLSMAAICALFVSQQNDVALAYPILKALFPSLASYIYLFAPAQLMVLNPFAYFALEWSRLDHNVSSSTSAKTKDDCAKSFKSLNISNSPNINHSDISHLLRNPALPIKVLPRHSNSKDFTFKESTRFLPSTSNSPPVLFHSDDPTLPALDSTTTIFPIPQVDLSSQSCHSIGDCTTHHIEKMRNSDPNSQIPLIGAEDSSEAYRTCWGRLFYCFFSRSTTQETPEKSSQVWRRLLLVLRQVILNPLFFMTVIGIAFNFALNHQLPTIVDGLLKLLSESFAATALFYLGYNMTGKISSLSYHDVYTLGILLVAKLVISPFIMREMVVLFHPSESANETLGMSTFAFLYGSCPTAPPVFMFAVEYAVMQQVIACGLVIGTFLSLPIMFILARLVTMYTATETDYDTLLGSTVSDVSWVSIACCLWTLGILALTRKLLRVPHRFTVCHLICVLFSCLGVSLGQFFHNSPPSNLMPHETTLKPFDTIADLELLKISTAYSSQLNEFSTSSLTAFASNDRSILTANPPAGWPHYLQFAVFFTACTGARLWTCLIAIVLYLHRARSLCYVLRYQHAIYLIGLILPLFTTGIILLFSSRQRLKDIDPAFQYGSTQLVVSLIVLVFCLTTTLLFLILYARIKNCQLEKEYQIPEDDANHSGPNFPLLRTFSSAAQKMRVPSIGGSGQLKEQDLSGIIPLCPNTQDHDDKMQIDAGKGSKKKNPPFSHSSPISIADSPSPEITEIVRSHFSHSSSESDFYDASTTGNAIIGSRKAQTSFGPLPCGLVHHHHQNCKLSSINTQDYSGDLEDCVIDCTDKNVLSGCSSCTPKRRLQCMSILSEYYGKRSAFCFPHNASKRNESFPTSVKGNLQKTHLLSTSNLFDSSEHDAGKYYQPEWDAANETESQRHLVLLMFLLISMFFGICLCTWRLVREGISGVYIALEFLDAVLNFGQGVIIFACFGLDADLILLPCRKVCTRFFNWLFDSLGPDSTSILPQLTSTVQNSAVFSELDESMRSDSGIGTGTRRRRRR